MLKIRTAFFMLALVLCAPAYADNLCTIPITNAVTGAAQTAKPGYGSPQGLAITATFTYFSSSATSVDLFVQTTIDGSHWFDIAHLQWTTASAWQGVSITGAAQTTPATLTDGAVSGGLAANTILQGFLGQQYRCKVTTVGTYGSGTSVDIEIQARY